MIERRLEERDLPRAKALWKTCFNDTDAFTGWYFQNYIRRGASLGICDGTALAAMLHIVPRKLMLGGREMDCPFIVGVATDPACRRQGYAGRLIRSAFAHIHRQGAAFCALYPVRYSFYEPFGFGVLSRREHALFENQTPRVTTRPLDADEFCAKYRAYMAAYGAYALRTLSDCALKLEEVRLDGGHAIAFDGGYALYGEKSDDGTNVWECAYTSLDTLLGALPPGKVRLKLPEGTNLDRKDCIDKKTEPFGMLRVINAKPALDGIRARGEGRFRFQDGGCPWNEPALTLTNEGGTLRAALSEEDTPLTAPIARLAEVIAQGARIADFPEVSVPDALHFDQY